ncbi:MAG: DUF1634 domain-containing protein [Gammaproteobacteria bacterium]|nr:DUF1634 domain-containing protein [Gammaproteobacteria bacterium]
MNRFTDQERPDIPVAGIVYGDIIYWGTIIAAVIALIGSVVTFTTNAQYMDPGYLLSALWEGKDVETVWREAVGAQPEGHWYLRELTTGNGLTMAGIALGVFIVVPGILGAAMVLFRERKPAFGVLALLAAGIAVFALIP